MARALLNFKVQNKLKGDIMEILLGIVVYTVVLMFLLLFGRFTKDCDNSMRKYFAQK